MEVHFDFAGAAVLMMGGMVILSSIRKSLDSGHLVLWLSVVGMLAFLAGYVGL